LISGAAQGAAGAAQAILFLAALLSGSGTGGPPSAPASSPAAGTAILAAQEGPERLHRVLVVFTTDDARNKGLAVAAAHRPVGRTGRELLHVHAATLADALDIVRAIPGAESVEADTPSHLDFAPNDPYFATDPWGQGGQWDMRLTGTSSAWDLQRGSANVVVAVVDTGADYAHPDLAAALLPGRNLVSAPSAGCTSTTAQDDNGHGTHVAGTIGAVGGNGQGIAGMAFGVRILPLKTLDCNGAGWDSDMASAITAAADAGARVINLSTGSTVGSQTLQAAVTYAVNHGSLVVAAAGNCGVTSSSCPTANVANYPAAFPNALAVGATDANDQPAAFSTSGSYVAVSAPGVRILSTYPIGLSSPSGLNGYALFSGTSMATPHVSGLAALLVSAVPTATVAQLRAAIVGTARDVGAPGVDTKTGRGRIDSLAALRSLQANASTPLATTAPVPVPTPALPVVPSATPVAIRTLAPAATATPAPVGACKGSIGPGIPPPPAPLAGANGFHASWYGQSGYMTLCPDQQATATVAYYNSGSRGWVKGRMGEVAYLGTWDTVPGQDRPSMLGGDGTQGSPATDWPRYNRIAQQPADYVGPGQVAWFQFTVVAPSVPGTYYLYLRPLVEGSQWMEDFGVYWVVTVRN
jgi:subtilisin family serine protease